MWLEQSRLREELGGQGLCGECPGNSAQEFGFHSGCDDDPREGFEQGSGKIGLALSLDQSGRCLENGR